MNIDYRLIGSRIKDKRKQKGYTQEILAEKLDVTVGYVSQVERGITKISLDLLAAIAGILQCDIAELITESVTVSTQYMNKELIDDMKRLSPQDKKLVRDFISLLLNR